jgi:uncharacterized protein YciI
LTIVVLPLFALAIVAGCAGLVPMTQGDSDVAQQEDYFVKLLGTRDGWPENMTVEEKRIMSEHFDYLRDLTEKKKVIVAGPVFDPVFGLIILRVDSRDEAIAIMDDEPSVKQGVHTYNMQPMRVSLQCEM